MQGATVPRLASTAFDGRGALEEANVSGMVLSICFASSWRRGRTWFMRVSVCIVWFPFCSVVLVQGLA